jgi:hypothetical protein
MQFVSLHFMQRLYLLVCCLFFYTTMNGQCVDPSVVNPYYPCYDCFRPVCGCDGFTYRNECAADNRGGLGTYHNYVQGVCSNFEFDFAPNPIQPATSNASCDYFMFIYVNPNSLPANAQVYIYDTYQVNTYFTQTFPISSNDLYGTGKGTPVTQLNASVFADMKSGVYIIVTVVNNERKSKKIIVVNNGH